MGDITAVKSALASRALAVAQHLLPAGKAKGHEWVAGSVDGEPGESLKVELSGAKAGIWSDFAPGIGGDLIDLWAATKRLTLAQAIDEARAWLGMSKPQITRPAQQKAWKRPPKPRCTKPKGAALTYLTEARNLPSESIEAYRVGEDGERIVFPFLLPDGTLALVKTRTIREGDKTAPTAKDCEPVLFGWQAVPANAREVAITEGEIDALSLHAYGISAMSVPFGGGAQAKQRWIESEFDRMGQFERIYLALDMDEEGEKAAREIANRLGLHRCYRVTLPFKDANECLVEGVSREVIAQCLADAKLYDVNGLKRPSEFRDKVHSLFWPKNTKQIGYITPFQALRGKLAFRPGEVSIWYGDTGAGKTQVLSHCVLSFIEQGALVCISSLEMLPEVTLKRMVKQTVGVDVPTESAFDDALRWMDGGLVLYELTGKSKVDALLETFDYARARYGSDTFVIDSLMRLGIAGDDYNEQDRVISRLVDWAIANRVHVHLVAHAKKGERDRGVPRMQDIKGAMELGANAANGLAIWRNRKHEEALKEIEDETERLEAWKQKPGVVLNVEKQRNGDFEGKVSLWFDIKNYRYRSKGDPQTWEISFPYRADNEREPLL